MRRIKAYKTLNGGIVEHGEDALIADISYLFEKYKKDSEIPCEHNRFKEWVINFVRYGIADFVEAFNQYKDSE